MDGLCAGHLPGGGPGRAKTRRRSGEGSPWNAYRHFQTNAPGSGPTDLRRPASPEVLAALLTAMGEETEVSVAARQHARAPGQSSLPSERPSRQLREERTPTR